MTPRAYKRIKWTLVLILVSGLLGFLFLIATSGSGLPPLPSPNGYDDFIQAGRRVAGDASTFLDLDAAQLKTLVASNAEPLRVARLGLSRQCSFPTEAGLTNFADTMKFLPDIKRLAQLLRADGRLAELENRPGDAAKSYVEALRLGNEVSRGGFVIQRLVGIACAAIGGVSLARLVGQIPCEQQRIAIGEMDNLDQNRVTFKEVKALEKRFAFHALIKEPNPIRWIISLWEARNMLQHVEIRNNTAVAHERLIMVQMALHCYQSDHGRPAERLEQLVPDYLKRIPIDPFAGHPFVYKAGTNDWLLYSIGQDGVDDGGKPARGTVGKGDLRYDSAW